IRFGLSLFLSASTGAKVGKPFDDLGVFGNEPAVRVIVIERARFIADKQVAQNGEVPVRFTRIGGLGQRRFVTGARFLKLSLTPLNETEFVVGRGLLWFQFQRLIQAGLGVLVVAGSLVRNSEIDLRRR